MGMASNLSQGLGLSQGMDFLGGDNVGGDFGASGGAFDGAGGMMLSQDDPLGRMGGLSQGHSSAQVSALALFFFAFFWLRKLPEYFFVVTMSLIHAFIKIIFRKFP